MKVYVVVNILTTPHGEEMGDGAVHGVFASRKSANACVRELRAVDLFCGRQQQYAVRSFNVED